MTHPTRHAKTQSAKNPALASAIALAVNHIQQARAALAPHLHPLTAKSRKRVPKMRIGGERQVAQMSSLVRSHTALAVGKLDPDVMDADLETASALGPVVNQLQVATREVTDTVLVSLGDAWSQGLDAYAVGQRVASTDAEVEIAVAQFAEFLKHAPVEAGAPAAAPPSGATGAAATK